MTSCENKTLVCEQKSYCCPKPPKPTKPTKGGATTTIATTIASGTAETAQPSGVLSEVPTNSPVLGNCEKCDLAARNSCFLSLHLDSNTTSESLNPDCVACKNCCDDALPHKCEVWKHHDFCDMTWYSKDKKLILCGKTCRLC